ncbi:HEPN domain-containing protein [Candidatus Micrarchaeota archaeon]|nr:HEPN domain-containing protein [Candidatus Micrarchaeota archaeon]MBU2476648.1 HEPN domain-containing protein [Candidatus Micrarchaeota archaeon]
MKISELVEKGLLIKSKTTEQEITGSITIAERFIQKAKGTHKIEYFDVAFSLAYQSMFHSARALLFKNHLKERSHKALITAIKELYKEKIKLKELLQIMDSYRITRHAIQYTGTGCAKEDSQEAIKDAEKLIEETESILFNENNKRNKKNNSPNK